MKMVTKKRKNQVNRKARFKSLDKRVVIKLLPKRPKDAHKGIFGRLLIIGGSKNYPGAPHLSALAAARVGAGLITIATTKDVKIFTAQKNLEFTYLTLPDHNGFIAKEVTEAVVDKISQYDTLLIGPGLGLSSDTQKLVEQLLVDSGTLAIKFVIDADGLNILSKIENWWEKFLSEVVLTPHPAEFARLTGLSVGQIQSNRASIAKRFAKSWEKVVVLKGANTVVASPKGEPMVSPFANPVLATAGTGDVLAGIIGGFLTQGLKAFEAACVGVYVHGLTAQNLKNKFFDAGAIASDLLSILPQTIGKLKRL